MADVSIIIVSHNKPKLVREAVQSVLDQTHPSWEAILVDSGFLYLQGCFGFIKDERFLVLASGETPELARSTNMASWCFNEAFAKGRVHGELVMYLCDDDLLYKDAFETFWNFYLAHDREPQAMYASQDIGLIDAQGQTRIIGRRIADRPAGRACRGRKLDCRVDYLQFCHTAAVLKRFEEVYGTRRYHSEDKADADHADGIFMERIGALAKVYPIEKVLSMNRRSKDSINLSYSETAAGRFVDLIRAKFKGMKKRLGLTR
ncbi:MAG: glycosyltransferase family 2 protein [Verrucomicrobia bacterium]|nr:glycosyltransferase family 2 protein [Verrucomicrobiota bacterium]